MASDSLLTERSKFLSYVLRHKPEAIGLTLDVNGWTDIDDLVAKSRAHGTFLSREQVEQIVASSPKRRFAISEDRRRIRASQGHSVDIDLAYAPARPPWVVYHGTPAANVEAIRSMGLVKMNRHHVHLSPDPETARLVGVRRGRAVVLRVRAGEMHDAGHVFFVSANRVWLTDHVPAKFIDFPDR
jgi:putative RNA 2'-phosphotransferase